MPGRRARLLTPLLAGTLALAACGDQNPVDGARTPASLPSNALEAFECTASTAGTVSCAPARELNGRATILGKQGTYVKLTSSNVSYNAGTEIFSFDVTVQNLLNESIGTPDGVVADPDGVRVFFNSGPSATGGTGEVSVANADGTDAFTGTNQPYFAYHEILATSQVSQPHTWQLSMPATVTTFAFTLFVETDVQYKLVINELMTNPKNPLAEASGEWVELYNAGTLKVDLHNLVIADSAASGRRPYHLISSSVVVQPGAYVVLGETTNTANNGGVPVDYAYGAALAFANSLDAFKISRVYGTDTLTLDRTQYASAAISAQDGISRELKNPALDNSNMDGSNWADALATATFTNGTVTSRGTPKAQNSTFTP
jgi:hypothetical protein